LIEGFDAIYITGSGQTKQTADRVKIYEAEGDITPTKRYKWKASEYHQLQQQRLQQMQQQQEQQQQEQEHYHSDDSTLSSSGANGAVLSMGMDSTLSEKKVYKRRMATKKESLSVLVKNPITRSAIPALSPLRGHLLEQVTSISLPSYSQPYFPSVAACPAPNLSWNQLYDMGTSGAVNNVDNFSGDLPDALPTVQTDTPRSETEVLYETYWSTDISDTSVASVLSSTTLPSVSTFLATTTVPVTSPRSPLKTPVAVDVSSWVSTEFALPDDEWHGTHHRDPIATLSEECETTDSDNSSNFQFY
jgi:hypothetical protein